MAQLFNSMDPTPFLNKDLDPSANDFIETWAAGHPLNSRFHLSIHIEQWPEVATHQDADRPCNHFAYKAEQTRGAWGACARAMAWPSA
jgi:hypothetical protein